MWHLKILISPNYTCLGHFHMEKSFLSGFGNYVAFPLLEIPVGPCNSNSCTFHHSSFSLNLHVFLSFLLYFPFDCNFFQEILSSSLLPNCPYECSGLLICQTCFFCNTKASQIVHSDDVNKVPNTESVPPE